jgi:hypothetical protein
MPFTNEDTVQYISPDLFNLHNSSDIKNNYSNNPSVIPNPLSNSTPIYNSTPVYNPNSSTSLTDTVNRKIAEQQKNVNKKEQVQNTVNKCFENMCEHLANGETTLSAIFQRFPSMYSRDYKALERIVCERDRLKKRPVREVTGIYRPYCIEEMEWADKYLGTYDTFDKDGNYYLGLKEYNNNLVYYLENEKYSDLLQMFTDNHMELKVKYGFYNFLPEMLVIICRGNRQEWCKKCKPRVDDCTELLKTINMIIECEWNSETKTPIYTQWMPLEWSMEIMGKKRWDL